MQQLLDLTLYRIVHRAMRNGTPAVAGALATMSTPDPARAQRLVRWYGGFLDEFHVHHTAEDEIFFPALGVQVAGFERMLDRVNDEHDALDRSLGTLAEALSAMAAARPEGWAAARQRAIDASAAAVRAATAHLDFEDDEILPLFVRHLSKAEYDELGERALRLGSLRSLFFTVPMLMRQATDGERAKLLDEAPLPLRLVYRASRRRYARLADGALGGYAPEATPAPVLSGRDVA